MGEIWPKGGDDGGGAALCDSNPVTVAPDNVAAPGVAAEASRCDHTHALPAGAPVTTGTANAAGTANTVARADHVHETLVTGDDPETIEPDNVAAPGTSGEPARADHVHAATMGSPVVTQGGTQADGSENSFARSDHQHGVNIECRDEGGFEGQAWILDFTGAGVSASVAGGVCTVDVPGGGGGGSFAQAVVTGTTSIGSGSWTNIGTTNIVLGAGDWDLEWSVDVEVASGSTFRLRLTADNVEIPGTVRGIGDGDGERWPVNISKIINVASGTDTIRAQVIRDSGGGSATFRELVLKAVEV